MIRFLVELKGLLPWAPAWRYWPTISWFRPNAVQVAAPAVIAVQPAAPAHEPAHRRGPTERKLSAATQQQALSALLFLYRNVVERPLEALGRMPRGRIPTTLPVVLTGG